MKKMIRRGFIVVMVAMLARYSVWSQGTIFVSNLGQPSAGSLTVGSDSWLAAVYWHGKQSRRICARFRAVGHDASLRVSQRFHGDALFSGRWRSSSSWKQPRHPDCFVSDPMAGGLYTYTASGLTLSPETDYFIVLTAGTRLASGAYAWSFENTSTGSSSGGWGTDLPTLQSSDGLTWGSRPFDYPQFALSATAVPEPETLYLLGLPGLLFIAWRRWRASAQAR